MTYLLLLLTSCVLYDRAYYERALLRFNDNDGDKWSEAQGDCDDTNADVSPWADEYCNGLDDDCNGLLDDFPLDVRVWYADSDHDGFGKEGTTPVLQCETLADHVSNDDDCDDADPEVYFGAEQVCGDPRDTDCDGKAGDIDEDEDGFPNCQDCRDDDASAYPGAPERCNALDDDCDGETDEEDAIDPRVWYVDNDGDDYGTGDPVVSCSQPDSGYVDIGGDCDDADITIHPNADEVCDDGIDDNCNGMLHECRATGALSVAGYSYIVSGGGSAVGPGLGDLNGDGVLEYALLGGGSNGEPGIFMMSGAVFGALDQAGLVVATVAGPADVEGIGSWMEVLGDTDRDEIDEWVIGADLGAPNYFGEAYVARGRLDDIDLATSSYAIISGTESGGHLGRGHHSPGDVGGDIGADLALGQPYTDALMEDAGAVHLYFEPFGTYTDREADLSMYGSEAGMAFGEAIGSGDFDGDGVTDLVVGADGTVDGAEWAGAAFVFLGGPREATAEEADRRFVGETNASAGGRLLVPGDVSRDGLDDLWVGASYSGLVHLDGGEWFLVTDMGGTSALRAAASAVVVGEAVGDLLGRYASLATDFDQDGTSDLILQGQSDEGSTAAGKIFVFYGPFAGEKSAADADAWYVGSGAYANAGSTFAVPGDLNGDAELDLIWSDRTDTSSYSQISYFYGPTY